MSPLLAAAARAKAAQRHLHHAQELQAKWENLTPAQQNGLREELTAVRTAAKEVQMKLSFGVRGFAHEFKAAKDGREAEPLDQGRPLTKSVPDLARALATLKAALDRAETERDDAASAHAHD